MKKLYELELTRHGVTPAQFLAYVRQMCKKHNIPFEMSARDFANGQTWGNGYYMDSRYTGGTPKTRPCFAETCKAKPYDHQTYLKGFDGSVYNEIIEFQFDDEKTGFGYFYTVSAEGDSADDARAVMQSAVAYHTGAIERNNRAIEKKGAELAETLRNIENGWADAKYAGTHANILRHEIEAAKRENEEHRAAAAEARAELAEMDGKAEQTTAAPAPLLLETVEKSLARLDVPALVAYYGQETAAMYDGEWGAVDDASLNATWAALEAANPAAFRAWQNAEEPTAAAYPPGQRTPEILRQIEAEALDALRAAYGIEGGRDHD